jgi:hypothetical protein
LRATDDAGEWAEVAVNVEVRHVLQPPRFIAAMPNVTVEEGETVFSAFNLLDYVFDPDNPKTSLIFSVADISNPNISVSMDINDNIEVRSKAGWDGTAVVKIKVSDGELSAIAPFNVTVVRHNRPPVVGQLPPVQLEQDGVLERSFNLLNFTVDTDTPKANLTFRIDDNTNPKSGVTVTSDGWVNIRPDKGWSGTAIVVVNVSDGEYGVRASFTVTVTPKAVTPQPVKETDSTLMYILMALVIVLIVVFVIDVMMRSRRPPAPAHHAAAGTPDALEERPYQPARKPISAPLHENAGDLAEPAAVPPIDVRADSSSEAPPAPAEISPETPARPAAEAPAIPGYEFPPAEAVQPPAGMMPVPSIPETPPETVPDMTPAAETPAEPEPEVETMETEPEQAPAPEAPLPSTGYYSPPQPAQEPAAGTVEEKSAGSAAALLASLQKPVPHLETEPATHAPEAPPEPPAQPAPQPATQDIGERIEAAMISKGTEGETAPDEVEQQNIKPITRVRCAGCRAAIPIFSTQRPLVVTCPQCGRMGMLK